MLNSAWRKPILARRTDPRNAVHAYTWYLVALKRTSQAKDLLTKMLTPEQIAEANKMARAKLSLIEGENSADWSGAETIVPLKASHKASFINKGVPSSARLWY